LLAPHGAQAQQAVKAPPPAVIVAPIKVEPVSNPAEFTGRVEAIQAVDIRARIQGFLQSVGFKDGQAVKAGDILFEIEPDQYQAAVASAQAQVASAEAKRDADQRTLERTRQLVSQKTASQAALDQAQAAYDIDNASVEIADAALRTAKLNLSYTRITAPIDGEIGRPALTVGNLVGPDSGSLARIVSLDPIRVAFSISEGLLVTLRQKESNDGALDPNALDLTLRLANGTTYDKPGKIDYVDNAIDPQTGTAAVRVIFANPNHILIPGQFVSVEVREKDVPSLPVVPQTAVLQDRQCRYVFTLGSDDTVSQKRIETGARVGNGWAVTKGLSGGDVVVVQGIQRLRDGIKVQPSKEQPAGDRS
jgi:membrane fusion protein (multidrug efflux system)